MNESSRRLVLPAAALAVAALVALTGSLIGPQQRPEPTAPAFTGRSTTVCPSVPPSEGIDAASTVTAVAGNDARAAGGLSLRRLDDTEAAAVRPGGADRVDVGGPTVLQADGPVAARSGATVVADGTERGTLAAVNCAAALSRAWLVGLRSDADHQVELVLTNPDRAQVEVNLRFFDGQGSRPVPGGRGIVVPRQSSQVVALTGLYSSDSPLAIEVDAGRGRISAAALQTRREEAQPVGQDVWAPTTAPALEQIIPGVPGGNGRRELTVFNPGDRRTEVSIEALGPDGSYVPTGGDPVDVGAGATATVTMGEGWNDTQVSLRIRASLPIMAGFSSVDPTDLATQPAAEPLGRLAVAPVAATTAGGVLALANPTDTAVTVLVTQRRGSQTAPRQLTIAAQASQAVTVEVARVGDDPVSLQVQTPEGSRVYGGIALRGRSGIAAVPLQTPAAGAEGVNPKRDLGLG